MRAGDRDLVDAEPYLLEQLRAPAPPGAELGAWRYVVLAALARCGTTASLPALRAAADDGKSAIHHRELARLAIARIYPTAPRLGAAAGHRGRAPHGRSHRRGARDGGAPARRSGGRARRRDELVSRGRFGRARRCDGDRARRAPGRRRGRDRPRAVSRRRGVPRRRALRADREADRCAPRLQLALQPAHARLPAPPRRARAAPARSRRLAGLRADGRRDPARVHRGRRPAGAGTSTPRSIGSRRTTRSTRSCTAGARGTRSATTRARRGGSPPHATSASRRRRCARRRSRSSGIARRMCCGT